MEKSLPSLLSDLKESVQLLSLSVGVQRATSDILEEFANRLYSLEEDRRLLKEANRVNLQKIQSLEKRYAELLYKFSELRK